MGYFSREMCNLNSGNSVLIFTNLTSEMDSLRNSTYTKYFFQFSLIIYYLFTAYLQRAYGLRLAYDLKFILNLNFTFEFTIQF